MNKLMTDYFQNLCETTAQDALQKILTIQNQLRLQISSQFKILSDTSTDQAREFWQQHSGLFKKLNIAKVKEKVNNKSKREKNKKKSSNNLDDMALLDLVISQNENKVQLESLCEQYYEMQAFVNCHKEIWQGMVPKNNNQTGKAKTNNRKINKQQYHAWFRDICYSPAKEKAERHLAQPINFLDLLLNSTDERYINELRTSCLTNIYVALNFYKILQYSDAMNLFDENLLQQEQFNFIYMYTNSLFKQMNLIMGLEYTNGRFATLKNITLTYSKLLTYWYDAYQRYKEWDNWESRRVLQQNQLKVSEVILFGLCIVDKALKNEDQQTVNELLHSLVQLKKHYDTSEGRVFTSLKCVVKDQDSLDFEIVLNKDFSIEEYHDSVLLTQVDTMHFLDVVWFQSQKNDLLNSTSGGLARKKLLGLFDIALGKMNECDSAQIDLLWRTTIIQAISQWMDLSVVANQDPDAVKQSLSNSCVKYLQKYFKNNAWLEDLVQQKVEQILEPLKPPQPDEQSKEKDQKQKEEETVIPSTVIIPKKQVRQVAVVPAKKPSIDINITNWSKGLSYDKNAIFHFQPIFAKPNVYFTTMQLQGEDKQLYGGDFCKLLLRAKNVSKIGNGSSGIVFFKKKDYREHNGHVYIAKVGDRSSDLRLWAWPLFNTQGQTLLIFDWLLNHKQQQKAYNQATASFSTR